jgi:hypothetical protein
MTSPGLARTVAILCSNPEFHRFLAHRHGAAWNQHAAMPAPERAACVVRESCRIQSRKELDSDTEARQRYNRMIGLPFSTWRNSPQGSSP